MLVLSRRVGESIKVGEAIVLVTEIRGNQVKLGVTAPRSVKVLRAELKDHEEERRDDPRT